MPVNLDNEGFSLREKKQQQQQQKTKQNKKKQCCILIAVSSQVQLGIGFALEQCIAPVIVRSENRSVCCSRLKWKKKYSKNFANLINHKVSQGAWGRREQRENITGNKEAWPSVLGNLHLHLSYLCLLAHRAFGFCDNYFSFTEEGYQPSAQPPTWRTSEITLRLAPTFRPVGHGCPCQEYKTPANIALGATGSRKPPHHDNPNRGFVLGNKT